MHACARAGVTVSSPARPYLPCMQSGALISTDGIRLLRKHPRAFPWSSVAPPETPHLHPHMYMHAHMCMHVYVCL